MLGKIEILKRKDEYKKEVYVMKKKIDEKVDSINIEKIGEKMKVI